MFKKLIAALCIPVICVLLEVRGKLFEKHPISFASLSFGADGSKEHKTSYTSNYGPTSPSLFKHQGSLYDDKFLKTKDQYPFKQYVSTPKDDKYKNKSKSTKSKYDGIANYFKHLHGDDHNFHKDLLKNDQKTKKHKDKNRHPMLMNIKNINKNNNKNHSKNKSPPSIHFNFDENSSSSQEDPKSPHDFSIASEISGENLKDEPEVKKEVHKITIDPHEFALTSGEISSHKFENNLLKILYEGLKTYKSKKPKENDDKKYPFKYLDDSHEIKTTSSSFYKEKQKGPLQTPQKSHYFSGINKPKEKPDYDFHFNKQNDSKKHVTGENKKPFSVFDQDIFKNEEIKVNPNYFSGFPSTTEKSKFDFWLSSKPTAVTPKNKIENSWFSSKPSKNKERVEDSWFSTKSLFGLSSKMKDSYGWFSSKPSYLSHTDSPLINKSKKEFLSTTPTNLNVHDIDLFDGEIKGTPESALLFENSPTPSGEFKSTQKPKFHFQNIFGDQSNEKSTSTKKPNQNPKISLEIAYGTKDNSFEPFFSIGTKNKGSSEEKTTTTKAPKKSKKKDKKKKKKKKSKKNKKSKKSKCKSNGSSEENGDCDESSSKTTKSKSKKKKKKGGKDSSSTESSEKQVIWHNNGIKINLDNIPPKYSEETTSTSDSSEWKEFDEYVHKKSSRKRKKKNKSKKKKGISFVYFSPN